MSKKLIIGIIFIIILISINWFHEAIAQDLSSLSEIQKSKLIEQYQKGRKLQTSNGNRYQSPEIYGDSQESDLIGFDYTDSLRFRKSEIQGKFDEHDSQLPFEDLKPFGYEMFLQRTRQVQPVEVASASDYILGPGDNIIIYLWGNAEKELNLTFDREGKVYIPKAGQVVGWGLSIDQFTQKVKHSLSAVYSDFKISVSLGKIRSIRVYITGEVKSPGAYTVSSLSSLIDAIYLAGGPNLRGSMRKIKLKRNGKELSNFDLYKFLLEGDNRTDIKLQSGDVIFVPVSGPRVAIRGQITRPAIYELNGNEKLSDLIKLSGNTTAKAHLDRITLESISQSGHWRIEDLSLNIKDKEQSKDPLLKDGDKLTVYSIYEFTNNQVAVFGMVKHPGYFERTDSLRISDIINKAQLKPYDVYLKRADLIRRYSDWRQEIIPIDLEKALEGDLDHNLLLQDLDSLYIRSIDEVKWTRYVYIEGEVKSPGRYKLYENMSINDLIFQAGSFDKEASQVQAEIARIDENGKVEIFYRDLHSDICELEFLREDDHVYIRSIPDWELHPVVQLDGEVKYPGEYMLSGKEETLFGLIQRAGGFAINAFPKGIVLERNSIASNLDRAMISDVIEKSRPLIIDSTGKKVKLIDFDYDLKSLNRIIINTEQIFGSKGLEGDIFLEPNDKIFVPSIPSGISVMGAVGSNGTIKFINNMKAKTYIELAGNFSRSADKGETRLVKANGRTFSGKKALGNRVELGDIIIVPTKIEKERNLLGSITTVVSAATGILTSAYLISKL